MHRVQKYNGKDIEPIKLMVCNEINFKRLRYDLEGEPKKIGWWQVFGFFPRSYPCTFEQFMHHKASLRIQPTSKFLDLAYVATAPNTHAYLSKNENPHPY